MIDIKNKIIDGENLSNNLSVVADGYTIRNCQLSQVKARTKIFEGLKGLIIGSGNNLKNCILPDDAVIDKDNLYDPSGDINNQLQQDELVETPEQIALSQKKFELEHAVVESFRIDVRAEISRANIATATTETIKTSVITIAKTTVK